MGYLHLSMYKTPTVPTCDVNSSNSQFFFELLDSPTAPYLNLRSMTNEPMILRSYNPMALRPLSYTRSYGTAFLVDRSHCWLTIGHMVRQFPATHISTLNCRIWCHCQHCLVCNSQPLSNANYWTYSQTISGNSHFDFELPDLTSPPAAHYLTLNCRIWCHCQQVTIPLWIARSEVGFSGIW